MDDRAGPSREATGELVHRLIVDLVALIAVYGRALQDHARGLGRDVATAALMIGAAVLLGIFALGVLVAALILVMSILLPAWLAALVVLGSMLVAMGVLIWIGLRRVRRRRAAWAAQVAEEMQWLRSLFPRES